MPRQIAEQQYTEFVNNCGKPFDSKVANDGKPVVGQDTGVDGKNKDTLIFLYTCNSTRHSGWVFSVELQTADNGKYRVSGLSCHNPNP